VKEKYTAGADGGSPNDEAQCRSQYFKFRSQVETAQSNLFAVENRLRYLLGLTANDGRLIHPVTPPDTSEHRVDWEIARKEALAKRVEVREQAKRLAEHRRWQKAAEAFAVASEDPTIEERLSQLKARRCQLLTARETAALNDIQLSVSHQLGQAIRDLDLTYGTTQTKYNHDHAAQDDVAAVEAIYEAGRVTLDLLLQAQQRRAEAASAYQRWLADYQRALTRVEWRKGTLLESMRIRIAE
jgi:hypothetical protein